MEGYKGYNKTNASQSARIPLKTGGSLRQSMRNKGNIRASRANKTHRTSRTSAYKPKQKSGFIIRFNIALTIAAALILLSKTNLSVSNKITDKINSLISAETTITDVKDKALSLYGFIFSDSKTDSVFSEENSPLEESLLEEIEENREMEEQLKNK